VLQLGQQDTESLLMPNLIVDEQRGTAHIRGRRRHADEHHRRELRPHPPGVHRVFGRRGHQPSISVGDVHGHALPGSPLHAHQPLAVLREVAPAELEAPLVAHPREADVGRHDERRGEVPVAAVVPRGAVGEADAEEIMSWVAERVAPQKRIRAVRFVDAIPRTPSRKLLRRLLAEQGRADSGTRSGKGVK
jgi:AMP-binding enzyme C-terminal domain